MDMIALYRLQVFLATLAALLGGQHAVESTFTGPYLAKAALAGPSKGIRDSHWTSP